MPSISSRTNLKIRQARALRQRKTREADGLFLVEGTFHVGAALEAGVGIEYVIYAEEFLDSPFAKGIVGKLEQKNVVCYSTGADIFEGLSDKENPQGLLAVVRQQLSTLPSLVPSPSSLCVAIVSPQDPGNLGSILRTMDAAGANALILLEGGVDPYHPSAVRAGMGAHFWHPIAQASFGEFAEWAKQKRLHVYGSSAHASADYRQVEFKRPCVLLLGSERGGLSVEQINVCEQVVALPMHGKVTSLNLAVAAGILIYKILA